MSASGRSLGPAWEEMRRVFDLGPVGGLSDGELLERFLERRDRAGEAAFAALVDRHGPTVLGVCRRLLGDPHAADDAFQATFLVLARRAPTISGRDRVGNWLYGVALRVSKEARARNARLRARERPLAVDDPAGAVAGRAGSDPTDPSSGPSADDLRGAIAEELSRLADRYRGPLLLCDLEGLSRQAAALRLGIPEGTLSSRLARGRAILRQRLTRRGLAPAGAVASLSLPAKASAAVPASLVRRTAEAAVLFSTRGGAAGAVPAAASALATEVLKAMTWTNFATLTATALFGAATIGAGLALASRPEPENPPPRPIGPIALEDDEEADDAPEEQFIGEVQDTGGKPISGATVVVGISRSNEPPRRLVLRTGEEGRFAFPSPEVPFGAYLAASKEGYAASTMWSNNAGEDHGSPPVLRLAPAEAFEAVLVDGDGKPIVGAEVRVETIATGPTSEPLPNGGSTSMVCFEYVRWGTLGGTPVAAAFSTMTGEDGSFSMPVPARECGLDLRARTADGRELRIALEGIDGPRELLGQGFLPVIRGPDRPRELARPDRVIADGIRPRDDRGRLILTSRQSARIAGRVISRVPGVDASGLTAWIQPATSKQPLQPNQAGESRVDASGHFAIEGLQPGHVNVLLLGRPDGATWAYRAADSVELSWDRTSEAIIELVPGVLAEGRVVDEEGRPVAGAKVGHHGPDFPRSGAAVSTAEADGEGRYHFRIASGEHDFYLFDLPEHYVRLEDKNSSARGAGSSRTVTIPEGVERLELPDIPVDRGRIVEGRVIDGDGRPVVGAAVGFGPPGHRYATAPVSDRSDAEGRYRFRLPPGSFKLFVPELPDGYSIGDESSRTIVIPDDAEEIEVPPLVVGRIRS